jgi:hypothetical protein
MNSSPEVTPLGMTVPKGIGTMLGKVASTISTCALSQVVLQSNSAERESWGGLPRRFPYGLDEEGGTNAILVDLYESGFAFLVAHVPSNGNEIACWGFDASQNLK